VIGYTATTASEAVYELAEGPLWDPVRKRVLWVDIPAGQVCEGHLGDDGARVVTTVTHQFANTVGAVATAQDGRLLVAGDKRLMMIDGDGVRYGPQVIPSVDANRFNDGKCDPAGNFVVGTLSLDGTDDRQMLLHADGSRIRVIDDDLGLSNGLAWSVDGGTLYSVDTVRGNVWRRSYDAGTASWAGRQLLFQISEELPDGMCVDVEGNLWIALWGAGQVRRYSPKGEVLAVVDVAAPHTSSVCFVGDRLDSLLITTARAELTPAQRQQYPLSGRLFTVAVDTCGAPAPLWNGIFEYSLDGV
jgi:sugar lactone lactonase YvrE